MQVTVRARAASEVSCCREYVEILIKMILSYLILFHIMQTGTVRYAAGAAKELMLHCILVPAVLPAAVAEEPFLLAVVRGAGVAFGTGGRFSPFSGV